MRSTMDRPAVSPRPNAGRPESFLTLHGVEKRFGGNAVLRGISLGVERGEILALLGPSGSGKTTLLRLLAGFEILDAGEIRVEGESVTTLPPARRRFGMVFQHYALFPHLTVGENVAFGLAPQRASSAAGRRTAEVLALVDLPGFEPRRVGEISGGQQQRVALARALAPGPRVLLLDEPLSNLDPALRERTRSQLKAALREVGITTVLVTHEQEEAFDLGDRVAVLHAGALEQVGTPEELYETPATRFVAGFVGRSSLLPGVVAELAGRPAVRLSGLAGVGGGEVVWPAVAVDTLAAGEPADLAVRPEGLTLTAEGEGRAPAEGVAGRVRERRFAGPFSYYRVELAAAREIQVMAPTGRFHPGDRVLVTLRREGPRARVFRPAAGEDE